MKCILKMHSVCMHVCFPGTDLVFFVFLTVPTGPPLNFSAFSTNPTILTLNWEDPEESMRNGVIIGYSYMCEGVHSGPQVTQEMTAVVTGLIANQQYTCRVGATTINGTGPFASIIQRTPEDGISGHWFSSSF